MAELILSPVEVKTCKHCKEAKLIECFHSKKGGALGVCAVCKPCWASYGKANRDARRALNPAAYDKAQCDKQKQWAKVNPEKVKARYSAWAKNNKEVLAKRKSDFRLKNIEKIKKHSRDRYAADPEKYRGIAKQYASKNPEKVKATIKKWRSLNVNHCNEYANDRYQKVLKFDPLYKVTASARGTVARSVSRLGYAKRSRTSEILGCDYDFFKSHIERQFLKGMTWDNRCEWHIDHITPMFTAKTEKEVLALNHFTNLRPMWAKDNLTKGAQITHLI